MAEFTRTDRALLIRVGGHLRTRANTLQAEHGLNWGATEESRAAKKENDRVVRDLLDLEALRKRLEAQSVPATEPAGGG